MTPIDYNNPNDLWRNNGYDPYKGMSDEERLKTGCLQGVAFVLMVILALAMCVLLGSCTTTKYVPVPEYHTDTLRVVQHQRDSIYLSDSIYISDFVRSDTVYKTIERWRTKYIERLSHDTIYQSKRDSIPVPVEVIKEVPRERGWLEKLLLGIGGAAVLAVIIGIVVKIKKFLP